MNLARVGSGLGPDLKQIAALRRHDPQSRLYAGGGVRNALDLRDAGRPAPPALWWPARCTTAASSGPIWNACRDCVGGRNLRRR